LAGNKLNKLPNKKKFIETYGQDGKLVRSHFDAVMDDMNLDLDLTEAFLKIAKLEELAQLREDLA
jgi:hypothetical protein